MLQRFEFLPPSCGDRLLSQATSCKLELHRWPTEPPLAGDGDDVADGGAAESSVELSFELRGELPVKGRDAAELLANLVREFRRPRSPRPEGGQP